MDGPPAPDPAVLKTKTMAGKQLEGQNKSDDQWLDDSSSRVSCCEHKKNKSPCCCHSTCLPVAANCQSQLPGVTHLELSMISLEVVGSVVVQLLSLCQIGAKAKNGN